MCIQNYRNRIINNKDSTFKKDDKEYLQEKTFPLEFHWQPYIKFLVDQTLHTQTLTCPRTCMNYIPIIEDQDIQNPI
jgi:hypothetical protein